VVARNATKITAPAARKDVFNPQLGQWREMSWHPDGPVYYRYSVTGSIANKLIQVTAVGDLDQDSSLAVRNVLYSLQDDIWQELPPPLSSETAGDIF